MKPQVRKGRERGSHRSPTMSVYDRGICPSCYGPLDHVHCLREALVLNEDGITPDYAPPELGNMEASAYVNGYQAGQDSIKRAYELLAENARLVQDVKRLEDRNDYHAEQMLENGGDASYLGSVLIDFGQGPPFRTDEEDARARMVLARSHDFPHAQQARAYVLGLTATITELGAALECAGYALSHPGSDQGFAVDVCKRVLATTALKAVT